MAQSPPTLSSHTLTLAKIIPFLLASLSLSLSTACYTSLLSFGDSLADTGNLLRLSTPPNLPHFAFPPYGRSYFSRPTGRCSDGRLVIDFIAQHLGLPLVPPYVGSRFQNLSEGVNFAVVGATALDLEFLEERGIHNAFTNASLNVQLDWFKQLLPSLCSPTESDCHEFLRESLVLMGEIGGNDFYYSLVQGIGLQGIKEFVPLVVDTIVSAIKELIELGAVTFLVPGNLPIGCSPGYLTYFEGSSEEDYDPSTGCLNWLNEFAEYHNEHLQLELNGIREIHPHTNIIYADYYNAAMRFYRSPDKFGFSGGATKACCGGGGAYNYNPSVPCGNPLAVACDDPFSFANWDGIHFTEATYRVISEAILEGPYSIPRFNSSCIGNGRSNLKSNI